MFLLTIIISCFVAIHHIQRYKPILSGGSGPKKIMNQGQTRANQIANPNRLKIIAGTAKGKKLESPNVYLRPMMAKVWYFFFLHTPHAIYLLLFFFLPHAVTGEGSFV